MIQQLIKGLQVIEPHFENNMKIDFQKGAIVTAFKYEVRVLLTRDDEETLKQLGWTYDTLEDAWVFPAYGNT